MNALKRTTDKILVTVWCAENKKQIDVCIFVRFNNSMDMYESQRREFSQLSSQLINN